MDNNKKEESLNQIERAILTRKEDVIKSLNDSYIEVESNINDNDLLSLVMSALKDGNGYFVYYMTKVIMKDESSEENSNWLGLGKVETNINSSTSNNMSPDYKSESSSNGQGVAVATQVANGLFDC